MSKCIKKGRLGNAVFRSIAASILSKKFNLKTSYFEKNLVERLGITLFSGDKVYKKSKKLKDCKYMRFLEKKNLTKNIIFKDYYQIKEISKLIHEYITNDNNMNNIMINNIYNDRYNNNNDCFIHIRLGKPGGKVSKCNPGFDYYNDIVKTMNVDKIYVSSDNFNHEIINKLKNTYKNVVLYNSNPIDTILFSSTCKKIILSYGTFSAIIGYFSFYSDVYYYKKCKKYSWDKMEKDYLSDKYSKISKWNEIILN